MAVMSSAPLSSGPKNSTNVRLENRPRRPGSVVAVRAGLRLAGALPGELAAAWAERLFTTPRKHERPAREREILATGLPFRFHVDGIPLTGWRWGEGPTVLLVHGWEGRGAQLGAFVAPLVASGHAVVTFDSIGHGDSGGRTLVLADHARAIAAAARAAGPVHAIVAHSFGAAATSLALARGLAVERVVYLAPPCWIEGVTERFAKMVGISEPVRRQLVRRLERRNHERIADLDGTHLARGMRVPLLLVHDDADVEVPLADGRAIAAAWPGARLEVTSGLDHRRVLWAPEVVASVCSFLSAP